MKPKQQKNPGHLPVGEKGPTVAAGSLQKRAPGSGPGKQSSAPSSIQQEFRSMQESDVGARAGAGTQQGGWSARQQAERMQARGEEQRKGELQQSGYGGAEQRQMAGAKESPLAPHKSGPAEPEV